MDAGQAQAGLSSGLAEQVGLNMHAERCWNGWWGGRDSVWQEIGSEIKGLALTISGIHTWSGIKGMLIDCTISVCQ
jgi:hypothetical protein